MYAAFAIPGVDLDRVGLESPPDEDDEPPSIHRVDAPCDSQEQAQQPAQDAQAEEEREEVLLREMEMEDANFANDVEDEDLDAETGTALKGTAAESHGVQSLVDAIQVMMFGTVTTTRNRALLCSDSRALLLTHMRPATVPCYSILLSHRHPRQRRLRRGWEDCEHRQHEIVLDRNEHGVQDHLRRRETHECAQAHESVHNMHRAISGEHGRERELPRAGSTHGALTPKLPPRIRAAPLVW